MTMVKRTTAMNKVWAFEKLLRIYFEAHGGVFREEIGLMDLRETEFVSLAILAGQLVDHERDILVERTKAGLAAARARGRVGGRIKGTRKVDGKWVQPGEMRIAQ
jgi:hypothetical protein